MFVGLLAVIPVFVKINNYKSYGLIICLKDGTIFRKKLSLGMKAENIFIINALIRERFNYSTKINVPSKLEPLEFCHK
jgi:hypothetical protein